MQVYNFKMDGLLSKMFLQRRGSALDEEVATPNVKASDFVQSDVSAMEDSVQHLMAMSSQSSRRASMPVTPSMSAMSVTPNTLNIPPAGNRRKASLTDSLAWFMKPMNPAVDKKAVRDANVIAPTST